MTREAFEAWISAPPYERSIERQGENGSWPGQYRSYETQAAWESWQESAKQEREACAVVCEDRYEFAGDSTDYELEQCAAAIRARKGDGMPLRLIVAGGRDYSDRAAVFAVLDHIHTKRGIAEVIHGAAPGADTLADQWGEMRGVKRTPCEADWTGLGKAAGPIRNRHMLTLKPDGVVLFPGGRGTADMRRAALSSGVRIYEPFASSSRR